MAETLDEIFAETERHMRKTIEVFSHDLATIRTGRASPALVEHIPVEVYGTTMPLNQLANITIPEPRLIVIQPWDRSTLGAIERAIRKSELNLNPTNDGTVVRIAIPPLTEERRRELVRVVRRRAEEARVAIRNNRRDAHEDMKRLEKEKLISADELKRAEERLQKLTNRYIEEIDQLTELKEKEILEV